MQLNTHRKLGIIFSCRVILQELVPRLLNWINLFGISTTSFLVFKSHKSRCFATRPLPGAALFIGDSDHGGERNARARRKATTLYAPGSGWVMHAVHAIRA